MLPNSVSYCRAEPSKVLAAAPRPREKRPFLFIISQHPSTCSHSTNTEDGKRVKLTLYCRYHIIMLMEICVAALLAIVTAQPESGCDRWAIHAVVRPDPRPSSPHPKPRPVPCHARGVSWGRKSFGPKDGQTCAPSLSRPVADRCRHYATAVATRAPLPMELGGCICC